MPVRTVRQDGMAVVTAIIALVVACSGDPSGPRAGDAPGTFTATLTGAATATLTGTATFVAQEGQGYEVEMLPQGSTNGSGLWVAAANGRPAVGDYAVTPFTTPQSRPTVLVLFCADTKAPCYTAWGAFWETSAGAGRLQITQSTATALSGSFEVDLRTDTGHVSGGGPLAHVSARFNARCSLANGC
jgi:hypothetical protein